MLFCLKQFFSRNCDDESFVWENPNPVLKLPYNLTYNPGYFGFSLVICYFNISVWAASRK